MRGSDARRSIAIGLVAATLAFALGIRLLPAHSRAVHLFTDLGWTGISACAAFRCLVMTRRLPRASHRRAFAFFGLACASWTIGMVFWDVDELLRGAYTPFPSIADAFYLALVPLFLAGFASYGGDRPISPFGLRRVGDLVMIVATMATVAMVIYGDVAGRRNPLGYTLVALAYPVVHLSGLVVALLSFWYRRYPARELSRLYAMFGSLLCTSTVNVYYGYSLLSHTYEAGRVLDAFWFASFAFVVGATYPTGEGDSEGSTPELRIGVVDWLIPPLCVAAVCSSVIAFHENLDDLSPVPIGIAGLVFCVGAGVRGVAAHRLERELREAVRARELELVEAQRMESVATLAGGLAHDFNNLLTGIMAGVGMLKMKGGLSPSAAPYVEMVEQSALRAAELTKRLLALARRREVTYVTVHPRDVVRHVASLLRSALPETIVVREEGGSPELAIRADAGLLEQALLNLGINAGHAMPQGGELRFVVETHERDPRTNGPVVAFLVSDTGVGIPASIRDRVFDPFFTTREQGEGTGLGLAMVRAAAEDHGGYVELESEVGKGTRFRLVIPRVEARSRPREPVSVEAEFPRGQETILVVDDRGAPLLAAKTVLETAGYQVVTAESMDAALTVLERRADVDLVLTDAVMPGGGAKELRARLAERGATLPVVVMSGHGSLADVGPGDVPRVDKPFLPSELARVVRLALDRAPSSL